MEVLDVRRRPIPVARGHEDALRVQRLGREVLDHGLEDRLNSLCELCVFPHIREERSLRTPEIPA